MTVLAVATALLSCLTAYLVGRRIGRQQGADAAIGGAAAAAHDYIASVLTESTDVAHHNDLHEEITVLRMALAEANRRLADTGVTISVEEVAAFYDIAEQEGEQP